LDRFLLYIKIRLFLRKENWEVLEADHRNLRAVTEQVFTGLGHKKLPASSLVRCQLNSALRLNQFADSIQLEPAESKVEAVQKNYVSGAGTRAGQALISLWPKLRRWLKGRLRCDS